MASLMMDNGAIPMSYFSPPPYATPAHQAPYYVIPQYTNPTPHFSAPTQYVYSPSSASEYGQSNGAPIFKVVPSYTHPHPCPPHNVLPPDMSKKEATLQEALENVLRQHKVPKPQMAQPLPQGYVTPHARHPMYAASEGTMLGHPALQFNGYPVFRAENVGDVNHSHLGFGAHNGGQYVNAEPTPTLAVGGSQPYGLPVAQPGMQWKLVPVGEDREEARGVVPVASPRAPSSARPVLMLEPEDIDYSSVSPETAAGGDNALSVGDDPYKQFLSLLFPNTEEKVQMKESEGSEGRNKVASSVMPEMEVKGATTPKSVRRIPVTDVPEGDKRVLLEGERVLKERDCSGTAGSSSVKKQAHKASTPTLKPIKLVPSLDFVKKKESKPAVGSKQEREVNPLKGEGKVDSHPASVLESFVREIKELVQGEKGLPGKTPEESEPKMEVAAKRAREKFVEGSSDVESHTVQVEKGDEPSAKKKKVIADSETAARFIQSVYRGYVVRRCQPLKHLRDIARVKSMLKDYQALAADKSSLMEKCKDPTEPTKISEGIMSLLLQLDAIQGVDPVVREIRKYTSKEVLKLQSEVDEALALNSDSPQVVSKEVNQANPLSMGHDGAKAVDKELAMSEECNSMEANESVERHHNIVTINGHETLVSKLEDVVTEIEPAERPVGEPEEQVEDLLRKLLTKLPESGGCERTEDVDAGEFSDGDDSALISEVVRRLSFLKDQQRENKAEIGRLNKLEEFSADTCAHGHIERQEEAVVSDLRASGDCNVEALQSLSPPHEEPRQSTMVNESAPNYSIFESTTAIDSAVEGEVSHVAPEIGEGREENKLPISEPATPPSELELQNLVETVAANFVDVVLTHNEDALGSIQSMADNKENTSPEGQDTTWHKVSVDGTGLPPQSISVDDSNAEAESPKLWSVESELEGRSHLAPTEIVGGETQTVTTSATNPAVVDGEDTKGMLQAFEVDNDGGCLIILSSANRHDDDGEGLQTLCRSECGTDHNQSDSLMDAIMSESSDILIQDTAGVDEEKFFELEALEECRCKGSTMASIEEERSNSSSTKSLSNEEVVRDFDLRDDVAPQQISLTEVAYDPSSQATSAMDDENTLNEDSVEVKVEEDNVLEEASPLSSADCSTEDNTTALWNGLGSTCHHSLDVEITLQSTAQDSEEVAPESAYLTIDEPCNYDQQSRTSNGSGQSVTPENVNVMEIIKVQIPNKSFPCPEGRIDICSPTSVLDAVAAVAPAEDVSSVVEIILDDTTSEVVTVDKSEGVNMEQLPPDSMNEEQVLQLQSAISDLQSLNSEGEFFLNDESLQLESAISDLHSLNYTGQGFLNDLNPAEDGGNVANLVVRRSSLKRISEEVYLPKPPSLSPEALHILQGGVSPGDVCERLCPSSVSSPSSETELTLTQHLIEENTALKELVKDVLKWSQWQSSATLSLQKMMERLALEVLEIKTTAKRAVKCKQSKNKKAAKKKTHRL